MGSIGSLMSPSARMTAASGIARQLATWPSCARSPSTSWGGTEHPGSACGRVASRPPGTMITCSLFWLVDFMRRPCQPLASAAGNAIEVAYAVDYLTGRRREPRFHAVTVALAAEMLVLGRLAESRANAERRAEEALASGRVAEALARMSAALGGPSDLLDDPARHLARAPVVRPIHPATAGVVAAIETREIGLAVVRLGGGRTRPQDEVDPARSGSRRWPPSASAWTRRARLGLCMPG